MSLSAFAHALALALAASIPAQTDPDDAWSDGFGRPGLTTRVYALGSYRGELIAGGQRFQASGRYLEHVARFDGQRWQPLGAGIGGVLVRAVAVYQGDLVVAGEFSVAGGQLANSVARWDGARWHPLGLGLQLRGRASEVFALAVHGGELYAGGNFDTAGGQPIAALARWNGAQWRAVGAGLTSNDANGPHVRTLQSASDGRLYVGGDFTRAGTSPSAGPDIASWDGVSWRGLGGGTGGTVPGTSVIAIGDFQGSIYAGGAFSSAGGRSIDTIARWDGSTWSALGSGIPDWAISSLVVSMEVYAGSLYVGGNFVQAGGAPASRVGRWDGARWHATGSGFSGIEGSDLSTTAIAMTTHDGKLYVGGEFEYAGTDLSVGTALVSTNVASWDGTAWGQVGHGLGADKEAFGAIAWNGGIVAFGRFLSAGSALTTQLAFLDGDDWRTLGAFDRNVLAATVFEGDLVVSGEFASIDGQPIAGIARYDGTRWSGLGVGGGNVLTVYQGQLYAGGTGGVRRWTGSGWQSFGPPMGGTALALHEHQGMLYVGGSVVIAGRPDRNLYAWDGTTMRDVGGGTDDMVEALTSYGGELIVGGRFSNAGGVPARTVAVWNGASWRALGGGLTGGVVKSFAHLDGDLYVGGDFQQWRGNPGDRIVRWDGARYHPLGSGLNGLPFALVADPLRGQVFAAGWFSQAGGKPSWNVACWSARPAWTDLGGGLAGSRGVPTLSGRGALAQGSRVSFVVDDALPRAPGVIAIGARRIDLPFLGGTLIPSPDIPVPFATDARGTGGFALTVPIALPTDLALFAQGWLVDAGGPQGVAATNAVTTRAR